MGLTAQAQIYKFDDCSRILPVAMIGMDFEGALKTRRRQHNPHYVKISSVAKRLFEQCPEARIVLFARASEAVQATGSLAIPKALAYERGSLSPLTLVQGENMVFESPQSNEAELRKVVSREVV